MICILNYIMHVLFQHLMLCLTGEYMYVYTHMYGAKVFGYINPSHFDEKNTQISIFYGVYNFKPI